MKKMLIFLCVAVGVQAAFAAGAFVVVPGDGATAADALQVRDYILQNTEVLAVVGDSAEAWAGKLILLERVEGNPLGAVEAAENRSVLNLIWLERDAASGEQVARRTGQAVLRHIAVLLGMPPCPFPLCVLSVDCTGVDCLDETSGNYCPPCRERVLVLAEEQGLARQEKEAVTE